MAQLELERLVAEFEASFAQSVNIEYINLSGGIGVPYKPDQEPNDKLIYLILTPVFSFISTASLNNILANSG